MRRPTLTMKSSLLPAGTFTPAPTGAPVASTTGFSVMHADTTSSAASAPAMRALRVRSVERVMMVPTGAASDRAAVARKVLQDEDAGADGRALVQVDHVLVQHADAAGRHVRADAPWLGRAMDAVDQVLAIPVKVMRAGPERVVGAALHVLRQFRTADEHLGGRRPIGPDGLASDLGPAEPLEAFLADSDAVAQCRVILEGDVERVGFR